MQVDEVPVPQSMQQLKSLVGTEGAVALPIGATNQEVADTALTTGLTQMVALIFERLAAGESALSDLSHRLGTRSRAGRKRMQAQLGKAGLPGTGGSLRSDAEEPGLRAPARAFLPILLQSSH